MKILVVCQYYYPEPFRITDICEGLVERGHSVTVLTGLPNYPEGEVLKEYKKKQHRDEIRNGVRIIRCYEHGRGHNAVDMLWNYFSFALSGKRMVIKLEKDFDLVFINQLSPVMMAWPGIKYAKKNNKKTLLYCCDLWPASLSAGGIKRNSFVYKMFGRISKKIYNQVDSICVTSKGFASYLNQEHSVKADKISYLPQYCEELFSTVVDTPHDGYNFVFAGNIGKMQSVKTIIMAASLLLDNKEITIHIVGDGRDLDSCKKLALEMKTTNVVFHGRKPIEEMPKFYSLADAMLVTLAKDDLVSESLPGKVQSYMASGKPIIAAIDGETSRVIQESKCGFVCEAEDYINLARLISDFTKLNNTDEMKNCATKYFSKNFTKDAFFNKISNLFNDEKENKI